MIHHLNRLRSIQNDTFILKMIGMKKKKKINKTTVHLCHNLYKCTLTVNKPGTPGKVSDFKKSSRLKSG